MNVVACSLSGEVFMFLLPRLFSVSRLLFVFFSFLLHFVMVLFYFQCSHYSCSFIFGTDCFILMCDVRFSLDCHFRLVRL